MFFLENEGDCWGVVLLLKDGLLLALFPRRVGTIGHAIGLDTLMNGVGSRGCVLFDSSIAGENGSKSRGSLTWDNKQVTW